MTVRAQTDAMEDSNLLVTLRTTLKDDHLPDSKVEVDVSPMSREEGSVIDILHARTDLPMMTDGKGTRDLHLKTDEAILATMALIGTHVHRTDRDQDHWTGILREDSEVVVVVATETEVLQEMTEISEERTLTTLASQDHQKDTETTMVICVAVLPEEDEFKKMTFNNK